MRAELLTKLTADTLALFERDGMATFERFARLGNRPKRHNGQPYRGGNVLPLWATATMEGYNSPFWMTFKQAKEYEAQVRKGEKGTVVAYWDQIQRPEGEDGEGGIWFAKAYYVFNACQIEGLPPSFFPAARTTAMWGADTRLEEWVKATGATVLEGQGGPCYRPARDDVLMPPRQAFHEAEGWYATLLHELIHWTGHESRINRNLTTIKDKADYALEELVAELGAALLCCDLGVSKAPREDHAHYLASWMRALKEDPMVIYRAGKAADVAADWLLDAARPAAPMEAAA
jgi:antirestriction protein ArdC